MRLENDDECSSALPPAASRTISQSLNAPGASETLFFADFQGTFSLFREPRWLGLGDGKRPVGLIARTDFCNGKHSVIESAHAFREYTRCLYYACGGYLFALRANNLPLDCLLRTTCSGEARRQTAATVPRKCQKNQHFGVSRTLEARGVMKIQVVNARLYL